MKTIACGQLTLAFLLWGCPAPGPGPVGPPDVVVGDAASFDGGSLCEAACARLQREGCSTLPDCPAVEADIERDRLVKTPSGQPLTCAAIVNARTLIDLGLRCP
jgi:hypothetical protein